jgi:hypothetical protein
VRVCWEGCYEDANPKEMPEAEVANRVKSALARVEARQRVMIEKTGFNQHRRYHWDQETAMFELRSASESPLWRARFLIAGSWASRSQSWLWSWGNNSLHPRCTTELVRVKREGERLGIKSLWGAFQDTGQAEAEELWVLAADILEAEAIYACREPDSTLYLLLYDLVPVH